MSIYRRGEARRFTAGHATDSITKAENWIIQGNGHLEDEDLVELIGRLLDRADYDNPEGAALAVQQYFNEMQTSDSMEQINRQAETYGDD